MQAEFPADPISSAQHSTAAPELSRADTGLRIVYSAVLAVVLHIVLCILTILVVVQLVLALATRREPHVRLQSFGAGLTRYTASIFRYLTLNDRVPPFPFSDLPDEA